MPVFSMSFFVFSSSLVNSSGVRALPFLFQGDDQDAGDAPLDGKPLLLRLFLELGEKFVLLLLELFDDLVLLLLVLLRLEGLGYVCPQRLDQISMSLRKTLPFPGSIDMAMGRSGFLKL